MPIENITAKWLSKVDLPKSGRITYTDKTLKGFAVVVSANGGKVFYRVGRVAGGVTRIKIAEYSAITVEQARNLCSGINADIAGGKNPAVERKRQQRTLGDVWDWYYTNCVDGILRSAPELLRDWNRLFAVGWGKLPLDKISRAMVIELQTKLRTKSTGAVNDAVTLLRAVFKCAGENGWLTSPNPMAGIKKDHVPTRDRFLLPSEAEQFFLALGEIKQDYRDLFLLSLFTGARRSAVLAMRWQDINPDSKIWTIPPSPGTKSKIPIRVTLATLAIEIIEQRHATSGNSLWVFPSEQGVTGHMISPKRQWSKLIRGNPDKGIPPLDNFRLHDLRRTLASWQAIAGESLITIGESLGHKPGSKATGVYARLQDQTVRDSVQRAADAIQKAGEKKIL